MGAGLVIFQGFVGGAFRVGHGLLDDIERTSGGGFICPAYGGIAARTRAGAPALHGQECPSHTFSCFGKLLLRCRVRHRFRSTFSRQSRQVRKEATVTGSFVCSGAPVPGFLFAPRSRAQVSGQSAGANLGHKTFHL